LSDNLALIQWYDFKIKAKNKLYKFRCPWISLQNNFDFVLIDSISHLIYVIPRFDKNNEYFVNSYLF